jgi:hypothetical protein
MREERMRITQQFAMGCEVSGMWFSTYLERVTVFLTWPLSAQKLTAAQERWHSMAWQVTSKVRSLEEAIKALEWVKGRSKA